MEKLSCIALMIFTAIVFLIAQIAIVLNPEMIILGGGIMAQQEYLWPLIDRELQEKLAPSVYAGTQVEFAKLKNDAGMIGALYNFLSQEK